MTIITFDIPQFRINFPEFADVIEWPDSRLQFFWDSATCFISDCDYGRLSGKCRDLAINLLTAHIARLSEDLDDGGGSDGLVTSATIDKVSVTESHYQNFKFFNDWWLSKTGYGQQYLALLKTRAVGGWVIGGSLSRSGYRKFNGSF